MESNCTNFEQIQHMKNLTPPYSLSRIESNEFRINFHRIYYDPIPLPKLTFTSLKETLKSLSFEIHEIDAIRKGTICMSLKIAKNGTANSLYAKLPRHMKRSGR